jgi:cellulose synthase/poly-beta-1,6-N-acetylglucosamine synthase-like glycosyltransferase
VAGRRFELMSTALLLLILFSLLVTTYFVLWNGLQLALSPFAARTLWRHQRRCTQRARRLADDAARPPHVSIVVPAFNEELTIVDSIRALLDLEYESREVVIVNDGSSDGTLALLERTFHLVPAPVAFAQPLKAEPVRGLYRSISEPDLIVVDKKNGGCKADASNAGINVASGALVLIIDADTILEADALSRAILPFLDDPTTIAVGANIGIANGCRIEMGRVAEVALPRNWLARFQIVEYTRAFLLARQVSASQNALVLISGAFGLFRRDALIAVGGYDHTAIGEDMDLTIRLQRHFRERGEPARIAFDPNPLCWTQAPEDLHSLRSQRCRWRRGLLQVLWRHRRVIGNPRYGKVGLVTLPLITFFEGLGPLLEVAGYVVTIVAGVLGFLSWWFLGLMVVSSVLFGVSVTLLAVLFSDLATRRYMKGRDLGILVAVALFESFGYRQANSIWGCLGTVQALTGRGGWGPMKRRAFHA